MLGQDGDSAGVVLRDTILVLERSGPDLTDWIGVGLTFGLVAVAGAAIWVEHRRARRRESESATIAHARVSGSAYAARRGLLAVLDGTDPDPDKGIRVAALRVWADRAADRFVEIKRNLTDALGEAAAAPEHVLQSASMAFKEFLTAAERLTGILRALGDPASEVADRMVDRDLVQREYKQLRHELSASVGALEKAMKPGLLTTVLYPVPTESVSLDLQVVGGELRRASPAQAHDDPRPSPE